jgi:hypothetical protein
MGVVAVAAIPGVLTALAVWPTRAAAIRVGSRVIPTIRVASSTGLAGRPSGSRFTTVSRGVSLMSTPPKANTGRPTWTITLRDRAVSAGPVTPRSMATSKVFTSRRPIWK